MGSQSQIPDHASNVIQPPPTKLTISISSPSTIVVVAVGGALDDQEVALDGHAARIDLEPGKQVGDRERAWNGRTHRRSV